WIFRPPPPVTVIVCRHEAEWPAASVAVQMIVVVPIGNGSVSGFPSLRVPVTVAPGQLPVGTGRGSGTCAEHCPAPATLVIPAGQTIPRASPVPWRRTRAGEEEASVSMATVPSKVAASAGVKVRQTTRLSPGARVPGPPPETIPKPATDAQS